MADNYLDYQAEDMARRAARKDAVRKARWRRSLEEYKKKIGFNDQKKKPQE